nr:hypothetical protein [Nocardia farcinica]
MAEVESGDEGRRLRRAHTGAAGQFFRPGRGQAGDAAVVGQQLGGEFQRTRAAAALTEQQRQQLTVAERHRPEREQTLSRPL